MITKIQCNLVISVNIGKLSHNFRNYLKENNPIRNVREKYTVKVYEYKPYLLHVNFGELLISEVTD